MDEFDELEIRWRQSGTPEDQARFAKWLIRAGRTQRAAEVLRGGSAEVWEHVLRGIAIDWDELLRLLDNAHMRGPGRHIALREFIEEIPYGLRPIVDGYLDVLRPSGWEPEFRQSLRRLMDEIPFVIWTQPIVPGLPPEHRRIVQARETATAVTEIVVRDAQGRELRRIPIDNNFDTDRIVREIAEEVPPQFHQRVMRWLPRIVSGLGLFLIIFGAAMALWNVSRTGFARKQVFKQISIFRLRRYDTMDAALWKWVDSIFALPGDPTFHGWGTFKTKELWVELRPHLQKMTFEERLMFYRRMVEVLNRVLPPEVPEERETPLAPKPAKVFPRPRRDYTPPAIPASPPPPPEPQPPRPKTFPELTKADILWRIRQEERALQEDEALLEEERGRLRWWRLRRRQGAPGINETIAELEDRIRRLRDRIAQRCKRMEAYWKALNDPHRERGRIVEFPPLPEVGEPTPLDDEEEREILNRIRELNGRIDDLIREIAKLRPHETEARKLLEERLRNAERERDARRDDLEDLLRVRSKEREEEVRALIESFDRQAETVGWNPLSDLESSAAQIERAPRSPAAGWRVVAGNPAEGSVGTGRGQEWIAPNPSDTGHRWDPSRLQGGEPIMRPRGIGEIDRGFMTFHQGKRAFNIDAPASPNAITLRAQPRLWRE